MTIEVKFTAEMHDRPEANRKRQRAFKNRMKAAGLVQCNGWVHERQRADLIRLMQMLRDNPDLTIGPARDERTGKLVKVR